MLKEQRTTRSSLMTQLLGSAGLGDGLLPSNQRRLPTSSMIALCNLNLDDEGSSRRAIGLLPLPTQRQAHEITETDSLRLRELLLSIESRATSCCIRVFSETRKSRSALLIYKGRLIGCVYGSRIVPEQIFGKSAFDKILGELVTPGNIIDTYPLSEEMVLASASFFHGGLNSLFNDAPAVRIYPNCAQMLLKNKRTGCIVVKGNSDTAVCVTYVFEGKIIGVYSFSGGWLTETQAAAMGCFESLPDMEVWMSVLPVESPAAETLTESLTGLDFAAPAQGGGVAS